MRERSVGKYTVGVGDAFPVEQPERPPERRETEDRPDQRERSREHWCENRDGREHGHPNFLFKATLILLVIWGALHMVNGAGPRGLLLAAAITFGIAVVNRLFSRRRPRRRLQEQR